MSVEGIAYIVRSLGQKAGVRAFSPHDLRRSFVSHLLEGGADLATVQRLVGHAEPGTTSRYDRRGDADRARAVELLNVPFREQAANNDNSEEPQGEANHG